MSSGCIKIRLWLVAITCLVIVDTARPDLLVTNAAGVLAGITGIVYSNGTVKSIDVDFKIFDPTGTNVTTFIIQRSYDLKAWADYSSAVTVTGSFPPTEISDLATNKTGQFYRMRLMNFR